MFAVYVSHASQRPLNRQVTCTYITVSRRGTCFWDGQPCATKYEKNGKAFQEVSEVSNTLPNVRIWLFLKTAILCFTSHCSLILMDLAMVVAAFWVSIFASVFASSALLSSHFLTSPQSDCYSARNDKLTYVFVNRIF